MTRGVLRATWKGGEEKKKCHLGAGYNWGGGGEGGKGGREITGKFGW